VELQEGPNEPPTPALIPSRGLVLYSGRPGLLQAIPDPPVQTQMLRGCSVPVLI
jgi:hypothetical protein